MIPEAHNQIAMRIARRYGARYNRGSGPDIETANHVIKVATVETIAEGFCCLRNFRKPVYLAGVDYETTKAAHLATMGTTVGVMNPDGKIVKRSTRGWFSVLMEKVRGPERMSELPLARN